MSPLGTFSPGVIWLGGFLSGGAFARGTFSPGVFWPGGLLAGGFLSGVLLSGGLLPGGLLSGGLMPVPPSSMRIAYTHRLGFLCLDKLALLIYILLLQKNDNKIPVGVCGGDLRASPHNFLAVGVNDHRSVEIAIM